MNQQDASQKKQTDSGKWGFHIVPPQEFFPGGNHLELTSAAIVNGTPQHWTAPLCPPLAAPGANTLQQWAEASIWAWSNRPD
jgi:hypothetical protein